MHILFQLLLYKMDLLFNTLISYVIHHHNCKYFGFSIQYLLKVGIVKFFVTVNTQSVQLVYVYVTDSPARCTNRYHGSIMYFNPQFSCNLVIESDYYLLFHIKSVRTGQGESHAHVSLSSGLMFLIINRDTVQQILWAQTQIDLPMHLRRINSYNVVYGAV